MVLIKLTGNEIHALILVAFSIDESLPVYLSGIKTKLKQDANRNLVNVILQTESATLLDMSLVYIVAMNNYMTLVYKYKHSDPGQSLFIATADASITYLKSIQKVSSYRGVKRVRLD